MARRSGAKLPTTVVANSNGVNAPLVDGAGNHLVNIPSWQTATLYPQGYVVQQGGVAYMATTTFTSGASFGADGANWAPLSSAELAYAQITSNPATVTNTPTVIAGLSITPTVANRPISVRAYAYSVQALTAVAGNLFAAIYEDGTMVQEWRLSVPATANSGGPIWMEARRNPAAGVHTYAVYLWANSASITVQLFAGAAQPAFIQALQI